ncbi:hypothetical protein EST38_g1789 [Candolleomyces aberdarensis]|uniref:Uncharacterized protein n=1 Tax=Candolleomyces aberdarensis TaxID=2316362 RepID=A0A4Q2DU70_9AGAR|nr:hypothetical protein EST38_g1789 [Candolleomyces aberdarensis]
MSLLRPPLPTPQPTETPNNNEDTIPNDPPIPTKQQTPDDTDPSLPPHYTALRQELASLPQHNLSLPYPEGATGRYLKFSSQISQLGWNNVLNEVLMNAHLAYRANRAYVFMDYGWKREYYPWPEDLMFENPPRTPMAALMSGPAVGGEWPEGTKPAAGSDSVGPPRAVSEEYFDLVCPPHKRRILRTSEVKPKDRYDILLRPGREVFDIWLNLLTDRAALDNVTLIPRIPLPLPDHDDDDEDEDDVESLEKLSRQDDQDPPDDDDDDNNDGDTITQEGEPKKTDGGNDDCLEIIPAPREEDNYPQVFDLWLWGSERVLSLWEEFKDSPVSKGLGTSPLVERCVQRNYHLFNRHLRSPSSDKSPSSPSKEILEESLEEDNDGELKKDRRQAIGTGSTVERDPFEKTFAVHIRRGDYKSACVRLAEWNSTFYSWNQLPFLPDHFIPPPYPRKKVQGKTSEANIQKYLERCLPDDAAIVKKVEDSRRDWEIEMGHLAKGADDSQINNHYLETLFILTNERDPAFLDELKSSFGKSWKNIVISSLEIEYVDAQEKDVGMAVDMDLARRAAVFLGNGDQCDRIAAYFDTHLELIGDIREIYNSRAALEREYAAKLQILARKAADKKARVEQNIAVGADPSKSWDVDTLKSNTLNVAYDEIINSISSTAEDHLGIADAVTSQVVEVLRVVERKNEEAKKKEMAFFGKLLQDRDRTYNDRLKNKQKYDDDCLEVEAFRQKQGRTTDDKHAERAAKQAEQQRNDMLNSKNVYLISIAIANQAKARFYLNDLPRLEDEFQGLQTRLVQRLTKILLHCQQLQQGHLDSLKSRVAAVETRLNAVNPAQDEALFATHNARPFTAPSDWKFEPCSGHYDTDAMSIDPVPKVFIQNKLRKCKEKLQELQPIITSQKGDAAQTVRSIENYRPDHSIGTVDDLTDRFLEAQHQLSLYLTSEHILKVEIETIVAAVGADEGGRSPHQFKSSSFSIPTQCGYCKSSIWGLSKQGKTCKSCGISVHTKCELKIPANCGQPDEPSSAPLTRSNTSATTASRVSLAPTISSDSSRVQPPTASSFVKELHSDEVSIAESHPAARVLFSFKASSEFELAVREGQIVHVVEEDDGSGWVKVMDDGGETGLVPATYIEETDAVPAPGPASTPAPGRAQQGSGEQVRALYPYQAQGADEIPLKEGDILELSSGLHGGKNYGEGWWEGYNSKGQKGIFPSNYVEVL